MIITDKSILETVSKVTSIEECRSRGIYQRLEATLKESAIEGAGLAAIQINELIRAIIVRHKSKDEDTIYRMINPIIEERIDPFVFIGESCLSLPGQYYNTDRYRQITIRWLDYDQDKIRRAVAVEATAVIIQHEVDHCDGILCYRREHHSIKIGRNDLCPNCLKEGIFIKFKKCKKHFI